MVLNYKGVEYNSGDIVVVTIKGERIVGKIHIENRLSDFGGRQVTRNYICHNNSNYCGSGEPRYGFTFSWAFYEKDNDGTTGISLSDEVEIFTSSKKPYKFRKVNVSTELSNFLENQNTSQIYLEIDDIFSEYDTFDISNNPGMIKMTGNSKKFGVNIGRKTMELKMGRFLNTYVNKVKDILDYDLEYTKENIEKIYNNYLVYQKGSHITIDIVAGDEILEGYKRENYSRIKSSLGGSCMTDHLDYLKIYTQNTNTVQMICIKMFDKVAGRALLWKTNCGKTVMEKAYICDEWVGSKFDNICKENNYIRYNDVDRMEIDINIKDVEKWPYLDTFYYMIKNKTGDKGRLFNYAPTGKSLALRSTGGEISEYRNNGTTLILE